LLRKKKRKWSLIGRKRENVIESNTEKEIFPLEKGEQELASSFDVNKCSRCLLPVST